MCGIIGYIGKKNALSFVKTCLFNLEYRGYDSSGVAVVNNGKLEIYKDTCPVLELYEKYGLEHLFSHVCIGHTRWATHGKVDKANAHPFFDCKKEIALVHNGTIENKEKLRKSLHNHKFEGLTDSEIIVHLIEEYGFTKALTMLQGSYALLIIKSNKIYFAKNHSPLIIGKSKDGFFFSSDIAAISEFCKEYIILNDFEYGWADYENLHVFKNGVEINKSFVHLNFKKEHVSKGKFQFFMRKEIQEQIYTIDQAPIIDLHFDNLDIVACGTSYNAGYLFSILLEKEKRIKSKVYIASEYPDITNICSTHVFAISQSGETLDTVKSIKFAKKFNSKIISLVNMPHSTIALESDKVYHLNAGLEIGVAATKTFMNQIVSFYRSCCNISVEHIRNSIKNGLKKEIEIKKIAELLNFEKLFFIGRSYSYAIAMEGALKFKELTYLPVEAYPSGEMKHGPLSIVDKNTAVICVCNDNIEKIKNNIEELKSRNAYIISLSNNNEIAEMSDKFIVSKDIFESTVILQLLAYYKSIFLGHNPDRPRNLAKSVTVE